MPKLTLTPSDLPEVADWKDGETYNVTLEVKQTSPNNFEIISAQSTADQPQSAEQEPQEVLANGGTPMRQKVMGRIKEKSKQY